MTEPLGGGGGDIYGGVRRTIKKKELQQPTETGDTEATKEGCRRACSDRFPYRYKDPVQQEGYDDCLINCENITDGGGDGDGGDGGGDGGAECPPEASKKKSDYTGCPCGSRFPVPTKDFACPAGYKMVIGTKGPSCRCIKWCEDNGLGPECFGKGGGGGAGGQQFEWSPELQALWARIMARANQLLDEPRGLSEEERQAIYNRAFEKVKGMERPAIQTAMDRAARMGMLESPYASREVAGIERGTRELLGSTARDIELEETQRRFNEMMTSLGMVSNITGQRMTGEQLIEALNAARRGEGSQAMQQLLSYLGLLQGGQGNDYYAAILNKILQGGQSSGSIWDWLPWLAALGGGGGSSIYKV